MADTAEELSRETRCANDGRRSTEGIKGHRVNWEPEMPILGLSMSASWILSQRR